MFHITIAAKDLKSFKKKTKKSGTHVPAAYLQYQVEINIKYSNDGRPKSSKSKEKRLHGEFHTKRGKIDV